MIIMTAMNEIKRTPLYQKHLQLSAKMVPFAGWEMPVSYPTGIIAEHAAVRTSAGLFDIGHMGLIKVAGDGALNLIQGLTTNDAAALSLNECQYSVLCNETGGTIDDILVYRLPMLYLVICNAVNYDKVLAWLQQQAKGRNVSVAPYENYCMLSLQGPEALTLASQVLNAPLTSLGHNHTLWWKDIIVSRTGYTGEDGVELMVAKKDIDKIWDQFVAAQAIPCGLGARDTLRLEAGLPLYGHEYDERTSPIAAGYSWAVKLTKSDFIGRAALKKEAETGPAKKLVGIELAGRAIPRAGDRVVDSRAEKIGGVTSGTFSPTLKRPIALAYLKPAEAALGADVFVEIRGNPCPAKIVAKTFYKR